MDTQGRTVITEKYVRADFLPYLNHHFQIAPEAAEPMDVELIEVKDLSGGPSVADNPLAPPDIRTDPFSLLFRSAPGVPLPQGIYQFRNATTGNFKLFIVPVAGHEGGVFYEAVFN